MIIPIIADQTPATETVLIDSNFIPGPRQLYRDDLQAGLIVPDAAQERAVAELEIRFRQLEMLWSKPDSLSERIKAALGMRRQRAGKGLYFWGGVGRGKTYLMDVFFHALPGTRKTRMHFHRFMLMVHRKLHEQQGHSNPLMHVARKIAQDVDVICFDEFFVSDIGDAMILANLLETLFDEGVMLIATSNIVPERLYENGLQRQKFLPAIALLSQHTKVINIDGGIDYRLQSLDKVSVYHFPLDERSATAMQALFAELTRGMHKEAAVELEIEGRQLVAKYWSEGVVWFDFATLCRGPRGAADYIELARQYHTVLISGIPQFGEDKADDEVRRFITLVDEFYDHGVKLVVSAESDLAALYLGRELRFPFERTVSRMLEMQTREYLAGAHHPD